MFEALNSHEQPLDHGSRVCHTHLFSCTPHVWLFPIKDPLHQQLVQNPIDVPHPCSPVPHPLHCLHPSKPYEVTKMEVIASSGYQSSPCLSTLWIRESAVAYGHVYMAVLLAEQAYAILDIRVMVHWP